jgi:hypothetical protein
MHVKRLIRLSVRLCAHLYPKGILKPIGIRVGRHCLPFANALNSAFDASALAECNYLSLEIQTNPIEELT